MDCLSDCISDCISDWLLDWLLDCISDWLLDWLLDRQHPIVSNGHCPMVTVHTRKIFKNQNIRIHRFFFVLSWPWARSIALISFFNKRSNIFLFVGCLLSVSSFDFVTLVANLVLSLHLCKTELSTIFFTSLASLDSVEMFASLLKRCTGDSSHTQRPSLLVILVSS